MKTSETTQELISAIVQAQAEFLPANFDSYNPFYRSKYASLSSVVLSIRGILARHDLGFFQENRDGRLITRIYHKSGQWMESDGTPIISENKSPQSLAIGTTYARRYDLACFLGVVSDEDKDGSAEVHKGGEARARKDGSARVGKDTTERMSESQRESLHAAGKYMYGEEWTERRHRLVHHVTGGKTESSDDLTAMQAETLITGINDKLKEKREQDPDGITEPVEITNADGDEKPSGDLLVEEPQKPKSNYAMEEA